MTDDESAQIDEMDEMTEQIEATFGSMSVYVSGTDPEDVQSTFDHVWGTVSDTVETMRENASNDQEADDDPSRTFG
jgi:hypothetical protein